MTQIFKQDELSEQIIGAHIIRKTNFEKLSQSPINGKTETYPDNFMCLR